MVIVWCVEFFLLDELILGFDLKVFNEFFCLVILFKDEGVVVLMVIYDFFCFCEIVICIGIMKKGQLVVCFDVGDVFYIDFEWIYFEYMYD